MEWFRIASDIGGALGGIAIVVGFCVWFFRYASKRKLSPPAMALLSEIDACSVTSPKGIFIVLADGNEGFYLPHLDDGESHNAGIEPLDGIIAAVDELVSAGHLVPHSNEGQVSKFRRTKKRVHFRGIP